MADAVALFHPVRREALVPFLDLDEESEESEGIYAEALEDGSFLLHTFQPFDVFADKGDEARGWLAQFGDALGDVHDDARGVLFFPDTIEPEARTYAGVVAEIGDAGVFVSPSADLPADLAAGLPAGFPAGMMAGIDPQLLQALADQLLGGAPDGSPAAPLPLEMAKLIEGMQGQLFAALRGVGQDADDEGDVDQVAPASPSAPPSKKPER